MEIADADFPANLAVCLESLGAPLKLLRPLCCGEGSKRQRMHRTLHQVAQRTVYQLVLLHHGFTFEAIADNSGFKVIAISLDIDPGTWNAVFDDLL